MSPAEPSVPLVVTLALENLSSEIDVRIVPSTGRAGGEPLSFRVDDPPVRP